MKSAKAVVIVNQPACSNVFLVDESNTTRLVQADHNHCFGFARGYAEALDLARFEVSAGRGDASIAVKAMQANGDFLTTTAD